MAFKEAVRRASPTLLELAGLGFLLSFGIALAQIREEPAHL